MRVALLSYNAKAGDAIGNLVAEKLDCFRERGAEVRVFLEDDRRLHPAVKGHCRLLDGPVTSACDWPFLSTADLIVVEYGQHYELLGVLPLLVGAKPRILFDYHGITPPEWWVGHSRESLEKGAEQRGLVWCADAAVAHSRFTARELLDPTGFPSERLHVLGHPVDSKFFRPGSPSRHLRNEWKLGIARIILYVGRLAPNKRVPILVDAVGRLRDVDPPVHLAVVGDTTDIYQTEAQRCRQRAEELGIADRLHLLGHVGEKQLLDAYRSADLFVMPSLHEGFCIPVVEAMACGIPVVAAQATALPETVGDAGLLFRPDDAEDLAGQVRLIFHEKNRRGEFSLFEKLHRQSFQRASEYDRAVWRDRFGQLVDEVLESPPRPYRQNVEVRPRRAKRKVTAGQDTALVPVIVANRGTHAVAHEGPGRTSIRALVIDRQGQPCGLPPICPPLPELVMPNHEVSVMMHVPVPRKSGVYDVRVRAESACASKTPLSLVNASLALIVRESCERKLSDGPALESVQTALAHADRKRQLPDDYADVTEGCLKHWKHEIKHKLLGNFKRTYVDVLSRQQSEFNRHVLEALQELTELVGGLQQPRERGTAEQSAASMIDLASVVSKENPGFLAASIEAAVRAGRADEMALLLQDLLEELVQSRQRHADLEARLDRVEKRETVSG